MLVFYAVLVTFDHYKLEYKYQATPDRLMFLESALTLRYYGCMCLAFLCSVSFENLQRFQRRSFYFFIIIIIMDYL